jgi:uncharacterized protein YjiS (DUF1127 family)
MCHTDQPILKTTAHRPRTVGDVAPIGDVRPLLPPATGDTRRAGGTMSRLFDCVLEGLATYGEAMYPFSIDICGDFRTRMDDQHQCMPLQVPSPQDPPLRHTAILPESDIRERAGSAPSAASCGRPHWYWLAWLRSGHHSALRWWRSSRELAALDERMLRDIGVEPHKIERARQPFDPFRW